jgi:cytochrome o ubiquinol oxidase subunit 3
MTTEALHHEYQGTDSKITYGLWIYILTDCIMLSCLFASFVVLRQNTYGGINITEVATLSFVLIQTLLVILMSFVYGIGYIQSQLLNKTGVMSCLIISALIALGFIILQYYGLNNLVEAGSTWRSSGFLSIYFIITVILAVHMAAAIIWMLVLFIQLSYVGITAQMRTRLACLSLFCNYLTLIWIFIFTIVYLMRTI